MTDDKITIDVDQMTLGDIDFFETYTGERLDSLQQGSPSGKALIALVYITQKKKIPTYTIEDAMAVPVSALAQEEDDRPTDADESAAS